MVDVGGSEHSSRAITAAFEEAALRDTELVAVHAWSDLDVQAPFRFRIDRDSAGNRGRAVVRVPLRAR